MACMRVIPWAYISLSRAAVRVVESLNPLRLDLYELGGFRLRNGAELYDLSRPLCANNNPVPCTPFLEIELRLLQSS